MAFDRDSMTPEQATVVLGPEWDDTLRTRLLELLKRMGATEIQNGWGLGGSQELTWLDVSLGDQVLRIEAETYIGLTISGPRLVVESIRDSLAEVCP